MEAAVYALNASGAYHCLKEQLKPSLVALLHQQVNANANAANVAGGAAPKIDDRALSEVCFLLVCFVCVFVFMFGATGLAV